MGYRLLIAEGPDHSLSLSIRRRGRFPFRALPTRHQTLPDTEQFSIVKLLAHAYHELTLRHTYTCLPVAAQETGRGPGKSQRPCRSQSDSASFSLIPRPISLPCTPGHGATPPWGWGLLLGTKKPGCSPVFHGACHTTDRRVSSQHNMKKFKIK